MTEPLHKVLLTTLHALCANKAVSRVGIIADENTDTALFTALAPLGTVHVLSNRWDIYQQALAHQLRASFNDFAWREWQGPFDVLVFRLSKEKALCLHVLNHLRELLSGDGTALLIGKKNEGIKTYHDKLRRLHAYSNTLEKHGEVYTLHLARTDLQAGRALEGDDYAALSEIKSGSPHFYAKPGVFGWHKIDAGSALLMDTVLPQLTQHRGRALRTLDLGCGYGYLSLRLVQQLRTDNRCDAFSELIATDNNAAALLACEKNFAVFAGDMADKLRVVVGDCGDGVAGRFNLILCNPPFHQGKDHKKSLTERFLQQAASKLDAEGSAYFVVNGFIPLERLAAEYFARISCLANNGAFKVFRLQKPLTKAGAN